MIESSTQRALRSRSFLWEPLWVLCFLCALCVFEFSRRNDLVLNESSTLLNEGVTQLPPCREGRGGSWVRAVSVRIFSLQRYELSIALFEWFGNFFFIFFIFFLKDSVIVDVKGKCCVSVILVISHLVKIDFTLWFCSQYNKNIYFYYIVRFSDYPKMILTND